MKKIFIVLSFVVFFITNSAYSACKVKDIMTGAACSVSNSSKKLNKKNNHKNIKNKKMVPTKREPFYKFKNKY